MSPTHTPQPLSSPTVVPTDLVYDELAAGFTKTSLTLRNLRDHVVDFLASVDAMVARMSTVSEDTMVLLRYTYTRTPCTLANSFIVTHSPLSLSLQFT